MTSINLKYGEGDKKDIVFISVDNSDYVQISFDTIKDLSKKMLDKKVNDEDCGYSIDDSLLSNELYKKTIDEVLKSVLNDNELIDILKSFKNADSEENKLEETKQNE